MPAQERLHAVRVCGDGVVVMEIAIERRNSQPTVSPTHFEEPPRLFSPWAVELRV